MKTAICIFLIYFEVFVACDYFDDSLKKSPKLHRGVIIYNPRKFSKIKNGVEGRLKNAGNNKKKAYTVFAPISITNQDVPNSPYFNQEQNVGIKPRVKKVLQDDHFIRKRSAEFNNTDARKMGVVDKGVNKDVIEDINVIDIKNNSVTPKARSGKARVRKSYKHHHNHHRASQKANDVKRSKHKIQKLDKQERTDVRQRRNKHKSKRNKQKVVRSKKDRHNEDKTMRKGKVRNRRLIASKDAMIEDYPYVVSIQKAGQHWCAGALLNPRLVITTANCIWKSNRMSRLKVRAGSRYVDRGGQVARIQEVMKHPYWSIRKNPDFDVGLMLLDRNIKFSDATHAVDLPNVAMYPAFDDAWVTSWGAERRDGVFENKGTALQVYHARLMDREKCNNVTQRFGVVVSNNFVCLSQTGRRAPCTRDTGAPAVSDGILWGLASWGLRKLCGTERYPSMFSYLGAKSNLDFITNATHYLMSDQRHYAYMDRFVLNKADTTETPTSSHLEY